MSGVISASGLTLKYPGCNALQNVDLSVSEGTVFALLGENGAGKTSLIKILTGFQRPNAGSCTVLGLDPFKEAQQLRRQIGYVSDSPALYDWMRVEEIGWFAAAFYEEDYFDRFREHLEKFELPPDRKIKKLSKGQRAKVALALALSHDPRLLIMDEPTSGLDPLVRREFLESMLDRVATGRTVLLSSHQISEVERVADEVGIIRNGSFCTQEPLQQMRESITQVLVSLDDPLTALPSLPAPAQVLREETEGRQRRLIVRNLSPDTEALLAQRVGVNSVQVSTPSLDDVFVAYIRGTLQERPEEDKSASSPIAGVA